MIAHIKSYHSNMLRTGTALLFVLFFLFYGPIQTFAERLIDSSGHELNFSKPFQRIISLYPAHTENLCSLGADEQLIGIGRSDDYPHSVISKPRFSYREDPEKFIAAHPDLVLIRPMIERSHPRFVEKLRQAGIPVFSLQPTDISHLFEYWKGLGVLAGKTQAAEQMINAFTSRLAAIKQKVDLIPQQDRPGVYFESIHRRMKTFAPGSIAMYALTQAGGRNIATDSIQVRQTNIADYGKERILAHGEDIDIFLAQRGRMNSVNLTTIIEEPGFKAIKAVRTGKVYLVDEHLVSRPTMRLVEGIEYIHHLLYQDNTL